MPRPPKYTPEQKIQRSMTKPSRMSALGVTVFIFPEIATDDHVTQWLNEIKGGKEFAGREPTYYPKERMAVFVDEASPAKEYLAELSPEQQALVLYNTRHGIYGRTLHFIGDDETLKSILTEGSGWVAQAAEQQVSNALWYKHFGEALSTLWDKKISIAWNLTQTLDAEANKRFGDILMSLLMSKLSPRTGILPNFVGAAVVAEAVGDTLREMAQASRKPISQVAQEILEKPSRRTTFVTRFYKKVTELGKVGSGVTVEQLNMERMVLDRAFGVYLGQRSTGRRLTLFNPELTIDFHYGGQSYSVTAPLSNIYAEAMKRIDPDAKLSDIPEEIYEAVEQATERAMKEKGIQLDAPPRPVATEAAEQVAEEMAEEAGKQSAKKMKIKRFMTLSIERGEYQGRLSLTLDNMASAVHSAVYLASRMNEFGKPNPALLRDILTVLYEPAAAKTRNFAISLLPLRTGEQYILDPRLYQMAMDTYMHGATLIPSINKFFKDNKGVAGVTDTNLGLLRILFSPFGYHIDFDRNAKRFIVTDALSDDPQVRLQQIERRTFLFGTGEAWGEKWQEVWEAEKEPATARRKVRRQIREATSKLGSILSRVKTKMGPVEETTVKIEAGPVEPKAGAQKIITTTTAGPVLRFGSATSIANWLDAAYELSKKMKLVSGNVTETFVLPRGTMDPTGQRVQTTTRRITSWKILPSGNGEFIENIVKSGANGLTVRPSDAVLNKLISHFKKKGIDMFDIYKTLMEQGKDTVFIELVPGAGQLTVGQVYNIVTSGIGDALAGLTNGQVPAILATATLSPEMDLVRAALEEGQKQTAGIEGKVQFGSETIPLTPATQSAIWCLSRDLADKMTDRMIRVPNDFANAWR